MTTQIACAAAHNTTNIVDTTDINFILRLSPFVDAQIQGAAVVER